MIVSVGVYKQLAEGKWFEITLGNMTIRTESGLTEHTARLCLKGFLGEIYAPSIGAGESPFEPDKTIAGATFGDLGTLFVDGNGVAKEITPFDKAEDFGGSDESK